jgi:hypothetical protein
MSDPRSVERLSPREVAIMSDFVLLFRTSVAENEQHMGTPEQAQKSMEGWLVWVRELEAGGHLKSPGEPLERTGAVLRGKKRVVMDGPFVEAKDIVAGFMVIRAKDLDEARELAKKCPMLEGEGTVEIRPVAVFPG